jgi:hypothetical protein
MRQRVLFAILLVFFFIFFVFRSSVVQDPDFGWHLQFGRLVTTTRSIPLTDPYSYSMPGYHFVNHEWGMDIVLSLMYDLFGIWPLLIGFSLIGAATLNILGKGTDKKLVALPLFLAGGTLFDFVGVRPQIISLLFLAVLSLFLYQKKFWQSYRFYLPLLFLIWANLHGGFAIGLVVLGIVVTGRMLEKRRFNVQDLLVVLLSLSATLLNPYGYHLWTEVAKSAVDPALRLTIQEWYPAIYFDNTAFWIYTTLSLFLLIRYYRRSTFTNLVLYGFLFISALASIRNIPVFVILTFYQTVQGLRYLDEEAAKHLYGKDRFFKGYFAFFIVCLFFFLPQLGIFTARILVLHEGQNSYPAGAVAYLRRHLPAGQIFTSYDWGGYLIWQLPQKKVFIDGRMPSWKNPAAPVNESTYAFGEYRSVLENNLPFAQVSKKYDIDTLLIAPSDLHVEKQMVFGFDVQKSPFLKKFIRPEMSFAPVVAQVKKMGWKVVYRDQTAIVFEK